MFGALNVSPNANYVQCWALGDEQTRVYWVTTKETQGEPGCEQYELFQTVHNPNKLVLMERWTDQAALDAHMEIMKKRDMSVHGSLRAEPPPRERYEI